MPELSNIQTFEKIDGFNIKPVLNRYKNFLNNIDLWNEEIKSSFDNFKLINDDGFVFTNLMELNFFSSKNFNVNIRPNVLVYS
jgi:hypothetical protein